MSHSCDTHPTEPEHDPKYRRALWWVFLINAAMFLVEIGAGIASNSTSLLADALDFAGDAGNIGLSLFVLSRSLTARAKASLIKAACMAAFGAWVLGSIVYHLIQGSLPHAPTMGGIAVLALVANVISALLLYAYRSGDSNMMSVWLCTRNDAIGNLLVLAAAGGVWLSGSNLPDLLVALIMVSLALHAAWRIARQARQELPPANKK